MPNPYKIRQAIPEDLNFIFATWSKSYWTEAQLAKQVRKSVFFTEYQQVIDRLLTLADVHVASNDDGSTIYGYIITQQPNILHWVYVKNAFSGLGLAKDLVQHCKDRGFLVGDQFVITHLTKDAEGILRNHTEFTYNPFLLFQKEK
jgi:ribosomal protein S18 acetylase RimI-like enzyme